MRHAKNGLLINKQSRHTKGATRMKKWMTLFLVLLLTAVMFCALAEEEPVEYTRGDYKYILLEDGTAEITDYTGKAEELTVPGELDGYCVSSIGDRAFFHSKSLIIISLSDNLTAIGDDAFCYCTSLTSITLPDSLSFIGSNPFIYCNTLTNIIVSPDHPIFATINGVLFNKSKKSLICYPCAFTAKSYTVPHGIQAIEDNAFSYCEALTSISLPDSVTTIGNSAFSSCNALASISLPDSITTIGNSAFFSCTSLADISLPDSITSVGANPFASCAALTSIIVSPDHPVLATIDGILFNKTEKSIICYPCAFTAQSYSVPQGIRTIGDRAFFRCDSLTSISLPDTLTSIANSAFSYCYSLTSISLPDSLSCIGEYAFESCYSLTSILLPNSLISIGSGAFSGCDSLISISLPDSITSIGDYTFFTCDSLTTVTLPSSITAIGNSVFYGCEHLTLTVERDSYARQYCKDNNLPYTYPDANDWLLN